MARDAVPQPFEVLRVPVAGGDGDIDQAALQPLPTVHLLGYLLGHLVADVDDVPAAVVNRALAYDRLGSVSRW